MEKEHRECKKCKTIFSYTPDQIRWDEHGYGYSTKLVACPECGCMNVIKYEVDSGMDINNDERFYKYSFNMTK